MEKLLLSFLLGLGLTFLAGLVILPLLRKLRAGQQILSYVEEHKSKSGTPTMGGVIFLVGLAAACLLTLRGGRVFGVSFARGNGRIRRGRLSG